MSTRQRVWDFLAGQSKRPAAADAGPAPTERAAPGPGLVLPLDLAPNDPLAVYFHHQPHVVEVDRLNLVSPALTALKAAGVKLVVPLVSQGELIGLLSLGPRLSEQEYSSDDFRLLNNLATQASPVLRVAQLAHQQRLEAQARERLEQELRVARLIQQTLLPQQNPTLPGWDIETYYQPARAVGGDFYDFLELPEGHLGILVGDVTDKGVPAALLMATTRAHLRAAALRFDTPGQVLARVNDALCPDIPPKMFVTCLYAILDPASGRVRFANAGHDLPYRRASEGVTELKARGMPLGLMPGMLYEERETTLAPGDSLLFYSDGLVEAHSPTREMFSFPRLIQLVDAHSGGSALIPDLLDALIIFTGPNWEQEDDITLVLLQRAAAPAAGAATAAAAASGTIASADADAWRTLSTFSLPSEPGNERQAMRQVEEIVRPFDLPAARLENLKTAVAEATMNAIEHGNLNRPELPVDIRVLASDEALAVRITDQGGGAPVPTPQTPDLDAKLAGLQSPRGWGLFLIQNMVDELNIVSDDRHDTVELIMYLPGAERPGRSKEG